LVTICLLDATEWYRSQLRKEKIFLLFESRSLFVSLYLGESCLLWKINFKSGLLIALMVPVWKEVSENEVNYLCRKGGDGMRVMFEKKKRTPVHHVEYYVTASVTYPLYQDTTT